jgi:hypothetical protein
LDKEFKIVLRDYTPYPRAEMIHPMNAASNLATMMGSIRFPVLAFVTPNRLALGITHEGILGIKLFQSWGRVFPYTFPERSISWVGPDNLKGSKVTKRHR